MKKVLQENKEFVSAIWGRIEKKGAVVAERIKDGIPYTTFEGRYDDWQDKPGWWTNTFWAGSLWLLYRETGIEAYKEYAQSIEKKMDVVLHGYHDLHHDVGFMWLLLSSVLNYESTGDEAARSRAMLAASVLSSRYNIAGGYIRAWNGDNNGWAIIDCMMNIPLLYWASKQSGDDRFTHIGKLHADKTMAHFIRPDGSSNHIVIFNEHTGEVLETPRGQGYESGSSWSRGQSWALYGFAQSYHWTGDRRYLDTAKRLAHYIMSCLSQTGYVPPCDYRQPADSELKDSSAGALAACGLIEIAKAAPEAEKGLYLQGAISILKALDKTCAVWDDSDEAFLTNATAAFHAGGLQGSRGIQRSLDLWRLLLH
jgi:unsaturated chondroitin disaccharide hydrolase